ncbi:hypothetical protein ANCCEY_11865 [Ancylostoma ceylanicum]|uniref:SCP domain-containing protein n=1 Tax=Ancylostoma ceylanicum TaxID=53326 RepID=A0A0D6LCS4_9BILA|nr:hypothetical protein ANCCEY_11865 [Ancylostoma ceylanicum]
MLTFAILALCLGWASAEFNCSDTLPMSIRMQIVQYHNERRDELLKGQVNGADGKLKPAKYMNKLTWSCKLEAVAVSRCKNGFINTNFLYETGAASGIVQGPGCYPKPLNFNDFKKAMDVWWNQAGGYKDNYFKDRTREEFAQMTFALEQKDFFPKTTIINKDIIHFVEPPHIEQFSEQYLGRISSTALG